MLTPTGNSKNSNSIDNQFKMPYYNLVIIDLEYQSRFAFTSDGR
jgi:hypothetical protein